MNTSLSKRENFQQSHAFTGTTLAFNKKAGAIIGLLIDLTVDCNITWHVSPDNTNWYAITPPLGTWSSVGTSAYAVPADYLAFLAPYSYARMTFSQSQTTGASVIVELMA